MKIVKVEWIDSCADSNRWQLLEDFESSVVRPTTYGFLIYEDDEKITVAQTYAEGDENVPAQFNGAMTIPRCSITKISYIEGF